MRQPGTEEEEVCLLWGFPAPVHCSGPICPSPTPHQAPIQSCMMTGEGWQAKTTSCFVAALLPLQEHCTRGFCPPPNNAMSMTGLGLLLPPMHKNKTNYPITLVLVQFPSGMEVQDFWFEELHHLLGPCKAIWKSCTIWNKQNKQTNKNLQQEQSKKVNYPLSARF